MQSQALALPRQELPSKRLGMAYRGVGFTAPAAGPLIASCHVGMALGIDNASMGDTFPTELFEAIGCGLPLLVFLPSGAGGSNKPGLRTSHHCEWQHLRQSGSPVQGLLAAAGRRGRRCAEHQQFQPNGDR